jgi:hypothetical protein
MKCMTSPQKKNEMYDNRMANLGELATHTTTTKKFSFLLESVGSVIYHATRFVATSRKQIAFF